MCDPTFAFGDLADFERNCYWNRWTKHPDVRLDHPIEEYRTSLNMWVKSRNQGREISRHTEAQEFIDWPDLQPPPQQSEGLKSLRGKKSRSLDESGRRILLELAWAKRRDLKKDGREFLDWQRPPKHKIAEDVIVLGTGAVMCNKSTEI